MYRRRALIALVLVALFALSFAVAAVAEGDAQSEAGRVVRVGFYPVKGLHEIKEGGGYAGYNYEYLQAIAQYTGWRYEFVVDSFSNCSDMLAKGEIDLMGGLNRTIKREAVYDFPEASCGVDGAQILTLLSNSKYAYEDFESFNNMRIGIMRGTIFPYYLEAYAKNNNFSYELIEYDYDSDVTAALYNGDIDAMVDGMISSMTGFRSLGIFYRTEFYFATTKGNSEILAGLNYALPQISLYDPDFSINLSDRFFSSDEAMPAVFSTQELDYIRSRGPIKAVYCANQRPIEYQDKETGEYKGITADMLASISAATGLEFEYIAADTVQDAYRIFRNGGADIITAMTSDYDWAISHNAYLTQVYLDMPVVRVDNPLVDTSRVAIPRSFYNSTVAMKNIAASQVLYADTIEQCIDAVNRGDAAYTFAGSYMADFILSHPKYQKLSSSSAVGIRQNISIGVSRNSSRLLLSIMNKALNCVSEPELLNIISANTVNTSTWTIVDLFYYYPVQSIALLALIFGVIILLLLLNIRSKSAQNQALRKLNYAADFDELTEIYHKQAFYRYTRKLIDANPDMPFTLVRFDIWRFKAFNDTFGTDEGDKLLKAIALYLMQHSIEKSIYGRLVADHFALCFPTEQWKAEAFTHEVAEYLNSRGYDLELFPCFGIYQIDDKSLPLDIMCDRANMALQTVKQNYTKSYAFYDETLRDKLVIEQEITGEMSVALDEHQFVIYLQPVYSLAKKEVVSAETLVRWRHPVKGIINPNVFIPIFEHKGLITKLDYFVWEEALKYLRERRDSGKRLLPLSVNMSRVCLYTPTLINDLKALIAKYDIDAKYLRFEITESVYADDADQLIKTISELQGCGFKVLMDDFGSGYSSLNMLKDVPVDILKIDMKFLSDFESTSRAGNILTSILRMAKWLNLPVIAEGVETREQMDFLMSIGCDKIQGYCYSHPLPPDAFDDFLRQGAELAVEPDESLLGRDEINALFDGGNLINRLNNSVICGIGLYEYHDGALEVLRVNKPYYEILGYDPEQLFSVASDIMRSVHPRDRELVRNACDEVFTTHGGVRLTVRRYHQNGSLMWLDAYICYLSDSGVAPIICISFMNITVQVLKEETIRLQSEQIAKHLSAFNQLYKTIPCGIMQLSCPAPGKYALKSYNGAAWAIYGYKNEIDFNASLDGDPLKRIFHDDLEKLRAKLEDVILSGGRADIEHRIVRTDGSIGYVAATLQRLISPEGERVIQTVFTDISKQKQLEHKGFLERYTSTMLSLFDEVYEYDLSARTLRRIDPTAPEGGELSAQGEMAHTITQNWIAKNVPEGSRAELNAFFNRDTLAQRTNDNHTPTMELELLPDVNGNERYRQLTLVATGNDRYLCCHRDITDRKLAEKLVEQTAVLRATQLQQERYRILSESVNAVTFDFDPETGRFTFTANLPGRGLIERSVDDYLNYLFTNSSVLRRDYAALARDKLTAASKAAMQGSFDFVAKIAENYRYYRAYYVSVADENGKVYRVVGRIDDIDDEKRAEQEQRRKVNELRTKAEYDAVTGLFNRATTQERITAALKDKRRGRCVFMVIDADDFKHINDTFGHPAGDAVLAGIASAAKNTFRADDVVGRIGGDEFAVFLHDVKDMDAALERLDICYKKVNALGGELDFDSMVTISVGIAVALPTDSTFEDIFVRADEALYQSKAKGKNRYTVYGKV